METQQALMKHFASILKKRVGATKPTGNSIDPAIIKHLHRKDLIEIITQKHKGNLPANLNLAELEKKELLPFIGDDLYIISHIVKKWCEDLQNKSDTTEEAKTPFVATTKNTAKIDANQKKKS